MVARLGSRRGLQLHAPFPRGQRAEHNRCYADSSCYQLAIPGLGSGSHSASRQACRGDNERAWRCPVTVWTVGGASWGCCWETAHSSWRRWLPAIRQLLAALGGEIGRTLGEPTGHSLAGRRVCTGCGADPRVAILVVRRPGTVFRVLIRADMGTQRGLRALM